MRYLSGIVVLLAVLSVGLAGAQKMVSSTPAHSAKDVAVDIGELNFHFDQDMVTDSWSFIQLKWAKFPPLVGKNDAPWVTPRHCRLKIGKLEPETIYAVQLNSGSKMGFRAASNRMPLSVTMVMFTTGKAKAGATGGATDPKTGGGKQPEPANPLGGGKLPELAKDTTSGGGKAPTKDTTIGGGAKQPVKDSTIGGGAKQPTKDTTIGGGNPLSAGGTAVAAVRKVMLRLAASPGLVVVRQIDASQQSRQTSRKAGEPAENAVVKEERKQGQMICRDTVQKVEKGTPTLISRKVESGYGVASDPKTGEQVRVNLESIGRTAEIEVNENGQVKVVGGVGITEIMREEIQIFPTLRLLPDAEVAVGEEWFTTPATIRAAVVRSDLDQITTRAKLVRVSYDPDLGCEVARIEGEFVAKLIAAGEAKGKFEIDFAPALGIVVRQCFEFDLHGTQELGSGNEAQHHEIHARAKFAETVRVVSGAAGVKPAGVAETKVEGK